MELPQHVVMFTGLPGTGKSVLAERAAQIFDCPLFSKDIIEAALWRSDVGPDLNSGWAAYELMTSLVECQLCLRQSAVLDSVATYERIRTRWRELAASHGATFVTVECVCSDLDVHQVEETRGRYEPCVGQRLILDAMHPLDRNLAALRDYLTIQP